MGFSALSATNLGRYSGSRARSEAVPANGHDRPWSDIDLKSGKHTIGREELETSVGPNLPVLACQQWVVVTDNF